MDIDNELLRSEILLYQLSGCPSEWLHLAVYSICKYSANKFLNMCANHDELHDLVVDCHLVVLRRLKNAAIVPGTSLWSYIAESARHRCIDVYRKKKLYYKYTFETLRDDVSAPFSFDGFSDDLRGR